MTKMGEPGTSACTFRTKVGGRALSVETVFPTKWTYNWTAPYLRPGPASVPTCLSEEVGEIIGTVDFADSFSSTSFRSLDHHRVADLLSSLAKAERGRFSADGKLHRTTDATPKRPSYFETILDVLDAAELIHVVGDVDGFLLLVVLRPLHRET